MHISLFYGYVSPTDYFSATDLHYQKAVSKVFLACKQRKMCKLTQSNEIGIQQIIFYFTNLICVVCVLLIQPHIFYLVPKAP